MTISELQSDQKLDLRKLRDEVPTSTTKKMTMMKKNDTTFRCQYCCDNEVKDVMKMFNHNKCSCKKNRKSGVKVNGKILNNYIYNHRYHRRVDLPFSNRKKYVICNNLKAMIERSNETKRETPPATSPSLNRKSKNSPTPSLAPSPTREQRLFLRNRIPCNDERLRSVKKVVLSMKVEGEDEIYKIDVSEKRQSQASKFVKDVTASFYRVPFGDAKVRE